MEKANCIFLLIDNGKMESETEEPTKLTTESSATNEDSADAFFEAAETG